MTGPIIDIVVLPPLCFSDIAANDKRLSATVTAPPVGGRDGGGGDEPASTTAITGDSGAAVVVAAASPSPSPALAGSEGVCSEGVGSEGVGSGGGSGGAGGRNASARSSSSSNSESCNASAGSGIASPAAAAADADAGQPERAAKEDQREEGGAAEHRCKHRSSLSSSSSSPPPPPLLRVGGASLCSCVVLAAAAAAAAAATGVIIMVLAFLLESLLGVPGELLVSSTQLTLCLFTCIGVLFATMAIVGILICIITLILLSVYKLTLEKPDDEAVARVLGPGEPVVFAHRAAALDAPENTMAAIRLAKANKAYGVELDLSFTKDGIAVAFHDDELDRTTNGRGPLDDYTYDEVSELDASTNHILGTRFPNERVPTMDEAVNEALKLGLRVILDIKAYDDRVVPYIVGLFQKHPELYERALVASFFPQVIYRLRQVQPKMVSALIWRPNLVAYKNVELTRRRFRGSPLKQWLAELVDPFFGWIVHNFLWHITGCSAVLIIKDCICPHYLDQWRTRGIRVLSWTPNDPTEKEYIMSLNVSIITDTLM